MMLWCSVRTKFRLDGRQVLPASAPLKAGSLTVGAKVLLGGTGAVLSIRLRFGGTIHLGAR